MTSPYLRSIKNSDPLEIRYSTVVLSGRLLLSY